MFDPDADDDEEVQEGGEVEGKSKFAKYALNERFQNVVENPFISLRGEATKRIEELPKISVLNSWDQITKYIANVTSETGKITDGFTLVPDGIAGGIKITGNQVFIKLCTQTPNGVAMYAEYSHAAKVAGHDLKGLGAVLSCFQVSGLHVPLMCIVDYKGYRALVMTVLPTSSQTQINTQKYLNEYLEIALVPLKTKLKEAKNDKEKKAIETEIDKEKKRREQMLKDAERFAHEIANKFSLQRHKIKDQGEIKDIYGPMDLEFHEGLDGRLYVLDLARLMPPVCSFGPLGYLYRLFRPEFMRKYGVPLSSDAFNPNCVDTNDPTKPVTEFPESVEATLYLQNITVPEAARIFNDEFQKDAATLKLFMHEHGVNLRYLGLFLFHLETQMDEEQKKGHKRRIEKQVIQVEMVARAYTHIINEIMRKEKREKLCKDTLRDKFNEILNYNFGKHLSEELKTQFHKMYFAHMLETNDTKNALKLFESNPEYWISSIQNNGLAILHRVSTMTGAKWPADVLSRVEKGLEKEKKGVFSIADAALLQFDPVEKTIPIPLFPEVHRANGDYLKAISFYQAEMRLKKQILGEDHLRVAIALIYLAEVHSEFNTVSSGNHAERYFNDAIRIYEKALKAGKKVELDYAAALERKAKFLLRYKELPSTTFIDDLLSKALELKKQANDATESAKTLNLQAWVAYITGDYQKAGKKYVECIRILQEANKNTPLAMAKANFSLVMLKQKQVGNAQTFCKNARKMLKKPNAPLSVLDKVNLATIEDRLGKIMDLVDVDPNLADDLENPGKKQDKAPKSKKTDPEPPAKANSQPAPTSGSIIDVALTASLPVISPSAQEASPSKFRDKARAHYSKAFLYRQQALGDNHFLTAFSLDHLAQLNLKNKETIESRKKYKQALPTLRTRLGHHHSSVGMLLHNIAIWFAHQNKYTRAFEAQLEATYILYCSFGPTHQLVKDAYAALESYRLYNEDVVVPQPMKHEGVLAPDQPDPASFWAPYQEEPNQTVDSQNEFKTFKNLLQEANSDGAEQAVNAEVIKSIFQICETMERELIKWEKESDNPPKIKTRMSKFRSLPRKGKSTTTSTKRNSIAAVTLGKLKLSPGPPFEFDDETDLLLSRQLGKEARIAAVGSLGAAIALNRGDNLPEVQGGPAAKAGADSAPLIAATVEGEGALDEDTSDEEALKQVNLAEVAEDLDPVLKDLSLPQWNELVRLTRGLIYNYRLLRLTQPSPFAHKFD